MFLTWILLLDDIYYVFDLRLRVNFGQEQSMVSTNGHRVTKVFFSEYAAARRVALAKVNAGGFGVAAAL
jgi:hypothetical protein